MKHYCNDPYCELCNGPLPELNVVFISEEQLAKLLQDSQREQEEIARLDRMYRMEAP
jgi:hypothetical protein